MLRTGRAVPVEKINHIRVTQSLQGIAVPIVFGTTRVAGKLIWTGDFQAHHHNQGGSKGFGAKGSALYTYTASWISLLCSGPIHGINAIWDQSGQYVPQTVQTTFTIPQVSSGQPTGPTPNPQWAAPQGVLLNGKPMQRVFYDYLGGQPVPTLQSGQYAVDGSGNYTFSAQDSGKTVTIQDSFYYNNRITQELQVVPTASPYQVTVNHGGLGVSPSGQSNVPIFVNDYGVRYYSNGNPLTKVASNPGAGQYSVSVSGGYGTYTFNSADAGKTVIISYEYYNYQDDKYAPRTLSVTFFPGLFGQAAWSYLQSAHPDQVLAYNMSAYAAFENAYLGMSASAPAHSYEVIGLNAYGGGVLDAMPIDCIKTLLTDPYIGIVFPSSAIDMNSWYNLSNSAANWCLALGFFVSEAIENQQTVASIISRWLEAFQIACFYSEGMMKLVPFGDQSYNGQFATYTPHTNVVANLTDDDFLVSGKAEDPIKVTRSPWTDAYNRVQVNFLNRFNAYNNDLVYEQDEAMISRFGLRVEPPVSYEFITNPNIAAAVANMRLKRNVTIRNRYTFRLPITYEYLEPMDIVTITDKRLGIVSQQVRIIRIENDLKNGLNVTAEDFPGNGYAMPVLNPKQITPPLHPTHGTDEAGQTNVVIVEALGAGDGRQSTRLYIYCSGSTPSWGGCTVWVSLDGTNYQPIGTVTQPAHVGKLLASLPAVTPNPSGPQGTTTDTTSTLSVQLLGVTDAQTLVGLPPWQPNTNYPTGSIVVYDGTPWAKRPGIGDAGIPTLANPHWQKISSSQPTGMTLVPVTPQVAQNLGTLSAVLAVSPNELVTNGIEFLAYQNVSSGTQPNSYNLTTLYRGAMGTKIQAFPPGSLFVRFVDASLTFDVPPSYVGSTVYFRFTAANSMGFSTQDLANAQTFQFQVTGIGVAAMMMTSSVLTSQGSLVTGGAGDPFTFSYTVGGPMTVTWTAFTLYAPDGTQINVPANSSGVQLFSNTQASTTYYFGGYYRLVDGTVNFVYSVGSQLAPSQIAQINADGNVPLFYNLSVTTPSSGGGGTTGGGNPGGGGHGFFYVL